MMRIGVFYDMLNKHPRYLARTRELDLAGSAPLKKGKMKPYRIPVQISPFRSRHVYLDVFYAKKERVWVGRYVDQNDYQIGECWYGSTRDSALVFRDPEPKDE